MPLLKPVKWALAFSVMIASASCRTTEERAVVTTEVEQERDTPTGWLSELIRELEQEDVANPPAKVYRYTYNEQEVYYLTGRCCDIPARVYDTDGNLLCEPEGGMTGEGDGRCPDFVDVRTDETLIWEDKREYN
ncbi:DUF6970 domain-containing protein [Pontibacter lucknowensis]|uniref:DUF6970 domain-containing protein n=1 Tax=Pontibacter lucknowensis TaxID=1077936 RepID=A0A1N6URI1_9BACT|nr:hypothetical protein [Pontibacter lucknowensis]SIQ68081.1 hypothetical protein SAMN05421545_1027 [Pontibacter lucknowensis]